MWSLGTVCLQDPEIDEKTSHFVIKFDSNNWEWKYRQNGQPQIESQLQITQWGIELQIQIENNR
jgi:hypothetical protein